VADTHPEEPEALAILNGLEAVARAERAICPGGVAADPAVAEGLALAGVRAASLADGLASQAPESVALGDASCVHHVTAAPGAAPPGAFELAATTVQEAVDHSLAAHLLSRRLGRPGRCTLAPSLARALTPVRLPHPGLVASLLDAAAPPAEPEAGPDRIAELAEEALREVGRRTGRATGPVDYRGESPAEVVLVSAGEGAASARATAAALSRGGVRSGALALMLLAPFPADRVREALAGARRVFVLGGPALRTELRRVADSKAEVVPLPETEAPADLLERLRSLLPDAPLELRDLTLESAAPSRRLLIAPAGRWAAETGRAICEALARRAAVQLGPQTGEREGAALISWQSDAIQEVAGDLLVAASPSLLGADGPLDGVRPGSTLLVLSPARDEEALVRSLPAVSRETIRERKLRLHWIAIDEDGDGPAAPGPRIAAAALSALGVPGEGESAHAVDPAALEPGRFVDEVDFRPALELPRMPAAPEETSAAPWASRIQRFHLLGGAQTPTPGLPIQPAALGALAESLPGAAPIPFALTSRDDADLPLAGEPLLELLTGAAERLRASGRAARTLTDNLERLAELCARCLAEGEGGMDLDGLLAAAGEKLVDQLGLPEGDERELGEDIAELRRRVPGSASAFDVRADTPVRLYLAVLHAARAPLRERFHQELSRLREGLRDLLELDRMASERGRAPEALSAALGDVASEHLDPGALARTLPAGQGSGGLDGDRRERVQSALATIEDHLDQVDPTPDAILVEPPSAGLAPTGFESVQHPDPLASAAGLFDGIAHRISGLFSAVRSARLEVEGGHRPEASDTGSGQLGWEGFTADELSLMPAVVALTTGRRLRQRDQGSLSELLRSSRPVHVIVRDEVGAPDEADDLSRFHVDLGYLVVAHRESFAIGTTLARPDRMVQGLARMVGAPRPGVFLAHLPALESAPLRPLLAEAALAGRACPDFRYEPDAGPSWADRFDLSANPDPERPWPVHAIRHLEGDAEATLDVALTFADAVALEPAYRRHFRIVPRAAWDDTQVPLAELLEDFEPGAPARAIPFVWVLGDDGTLQRAVVTRELTLATRDRLRSWRVLQELAGYDNAFAARAAEAARSEAQAAAGARVAEIEEARAEELERARREAARESMERLAAVLISSDGLPSVPAAPALAAPAATPLQEPTARVAEPAAPAEAPEAEAEEEEEEISLGEPYIDAPLCTTCNECTDINALLFKYNADKQAYIADPAAGSFAELVRAAELCPARCIHPGAPRSGDTTATPELIERAAAFN
jgi:ferredoxin